MSVGNSVRCRAGLDGYNSCVEDSTPRGGKAKRDAKQRTARAFRRSKGSEIARSIEESVFSLSMDSTDYAIC
jgi:hypothetical protein